MITAAPVKVNVSPLGFWMYATQFADAERRLPRQHRYPPKRGAFSPVPYYLLCRTIELLFKSYLLTKGWKKQGLRRLGHDLPKALKACNSSGLGNLVTLTNLEKTALNNTQEYYRDKALEYFEVDKAVRAYAGLPSLPALRRIVKKLTKAVEEPCRNAA